MFLSESVSMFDREKLISKAITFSIADPRIVRLGIVLMAWP